nr:hypothetical protein [Tanacetum cinerariifolium]
MIFVELKVLGFILGPPASKRTRRLFEASSCLFFGEDLSWAFAHGEEQSLARSSIDRHFSFFDPGVGFFHQALVGGREVWERCSTKLRPGAFAFSLLDVVNRQIRNEDLRTKLEYFSEEYDEEREMEPRPETNREATPTLRPRSPMVRKQRERVVGFKEAPNREGSRRGPNTEGIRPSEIEAKNIGVNLPPLLAAHLRRNESGQPLRSSLTFVQGGHQPSNNMGESPFERQKTGSILKYENLKAKFRSHFDFGSTQRATYLWFYPWFMDKKLSRVSLHRPPDHYKGLMEKTYTWIEAKEVATNGTPNDRRENFKRSKKSSWENNRGQKVRDRASKVDSKVPLIGFSREKSWSIGKIPLEITVGDLPLTRKKTLNFMIVKSDSPYNMLLRRTAAQKMEIVVSTIHGVIKFHTTRGIGTLFLAHESDKPRQANQAKKKGSVPDRNTTACKEVEELMKAGILREFKRHTWVAKPVMGYHHIQMTEGDEDKMAFFIREGVFCYRKMPFGLKNAGATYQRLVDKVFHDQIGRNLEAYVDDMVTKIMSEEEMLADIKETFEKF